MGVEGYRSCSASDELYETVKPYLKFFDKSGVRMEAKSSSGLFHLRNGFARGDDYLSVQSSGFFARGKSWKWSQKSEAGSHRMVFRDNGKVSFATDLGEVFGRKGTRRYQVGARRKPRFPREGRNLRPYRSPSRLHRILWLQVKQAITSSSKEMFRWKARN